MRDAHVQLAAVAAAAAECMRVLAECSVYNWCGRYKYNTVMQQVLPALLSGGIWLCDIFPINLITCTCIVSTSTHPYISVKHD